MGFEKEPFGSLRLTQLSRRSYRLGLVAIIVFFFTAAGCRGRIISRNSEQPTWPANQNEGRDGPLIPRKIWQIFLPMQGTAGNPIDPQAIGDTVSWLAMNPDYQ